MATALKFLGKAQPSFEVGARFIEACRGLGSKWEQFAGKGSPVRSKWQVRIFCTFLTLVVAVIGVFTRGHLSITVLYAIPVALMAWLSDATSALLLSFLSAVVFILTVEWPDLWRMPRPTTMGIAIFRFSFYAATSVAIGRLSHLHRDLQSIAETRAKALAAEVSNRENLEREMLAISEREQRRIGQDLHDGLCQMLTAATLAGNAHTRYLQAGGRAAESEDVKRFVKYAEDAILLAKSIANGLDPMDLQKDGLMAALEQFADTTSDLFGIQCRFQCHFPVMMGSHHTAIHLYRIAQEAVGNAFKHGGASVVDIGLGETDSAIILSIIDNGCGFSPEANLSRGRGLRTMTVRSKLIGGNLSIRPFEKGGTEVTCSVPMDYLHH